MFDTAMGRGILAAVVRRGLAMILMGWIGSGFVQLRAAGVVTNASFASLVKAMEGGGVVQLSFNGTILFEYEIDVVFDTVLNATGRQVIFSGDQKRRLFTIAPGTELGLGSLTLTTGLSTHGGAVYNNGGVLLATNCVFTGNRAEGTAGVNGKAGADRVGEGGDGKDATAGTEGRGGAIYNGGEVRLYSCQFNGNQATGGDGGAGGNGGNGTWRGGNGGHGADGASALGGAIYNKASLWLTHCTLSSNTAQGGAGGEGGTNGVGVATAYAGGGGHGGNALGGAIYNAKDLVVNQSTLTENKAAAGNAASSGGYLNEGSGGEEGPDGGWAAGGALENVSQAQIVQCTFYNNQVQGGDAGAGGRGVIGGAQGGDGGHAYGGSLDNAGGISLTNCTLASGLAAGGTPGQSSEVRTGQETGKPGQDLGSILSNRAGTFRLQNTIVAYAESGKNSHGTLTDLGGNLSSDDSCHFSSGTSRNSIDPKLGPLSDNGGDTETMALLADSPAIDKAIAIEALEVDQRDSPRPEGLGYDSGAYEASVFAISGRVLSGTNGVPGIKMTLISTNTTQTAVTDSRGIYRFSNLLPDVYRVSPPQEAGYTPPYRMIHLDWLETSAVNQDFTIVPSQITDLRWDGERVLVTAQGIPGVAYRLQASPDLAQWTTVSTAKASATPGEIQFVEEGVRQNQTRYYRLAMP
ncbi:MAG TPA: choice-of-anchor Q domain-containing protein [Candidatus Paceibacterota bacterium]|nr:choice-of-anchor Q domain-containing protein [Candidatus Paceibacterota bacterium]